MPVEYWEGGGRGGGQLRHTLITWLTSCKLEVDQKDAAS